MWRKLTRILHLLLVLAGIFALTAFGILQVEGYKLVKRANSDMTSIEAQSNQAAHTLGIILARAAVVTDELSKLSVVENHYWRVQNRQMSQVMASVNQTAKQADKTLASLQNMVDATNENLNNRLLPSATQSVEKLQDAEVKLASTIDEGHQSLAIFNTDTLPKFNSDLDQLHAATVQATDTLANANSAMSHVDHVAQVYDKKLTQAKTVAQTIIHGVANFTIHFAADIVALAAFHQFP